MMRSLQRGKFVALAALVMALVVAALALHRPIEDAWLIHVVRTGDLEARASAAGRLVEHECWRAVPDLLQSAVELNHDGRYPIEDVLSRLARPRALPYIRVALRNPEEFVRLVCIRMLDTMEPFDRETVELLAMAIEDHPAVRDEAARALKSLGPLVRDAAPALRRTLEASPGAEELRLCREALAACGQLDVADAKALLSSGQENLREHALHIARVSKAEPSVSVPLCSAALSDDKVEVREEAAETLADLSRRSDEALRALVDALRPSSASWILDAVIGAGDRAVPIIQSVMTSDPIELHTAARALLPWIWVKAGVLRPEILSSLEGRGPFEPQGAVLFCADIGPTAREAAPALERLLDAKEVRLRLAAKVALSRVLPDPHPGVPRGRDLFALLLPACRSDDAELRHGAARALAHAGPAVLEMLLDTEEVRPFEKLLILRYEERAVSFSESVVQKAIDRLFDSDPDARELASFVLAHGKLSDAAEAAAAELIFEAAGGDDPTNGQLGFKVLLRIGGHPREARFEILSRGRECEWSDLVALLGGDARTLSRGLSLCLRTLSEKDPPVRLRVSRGLRHRESFAAQVAPALLKTMRGRDPKIAVFAAQAMEKLGAAVIPGLVSALRDKREHVRCLAAFTLGRMGEAAAPALPALEAAARDESDLVRGTAEYAVRLVREWMREGGLGR